MVDKAGTHEQENMAIWSQRSFLLHGLLWTETNIHTARV